MKLFNALPPHRLLEFLEKKEDELAKAKASIPEIMSAFTQIKKEHTALLEAEIFVGMKGLRTAYDLLYIDLDTGSDVLYFYSHDPSYLEHADKFYRKEWPRLHLKKIKIRGIADSDFKRTKLSRSLPRFINERHVPFPVPGTIDIVKGKVLLVSWSEKPVGILIHSKQTSDGFRNYFEAVWKLAKE